MTAVIRQYNRRERERLFELMVEDPKSAEVFCRAQRRLYAEQDALMDKMQTDTLERQTEHLKAARGIILPYVGAPLDQVPKDVTEAYVNELDKASSLGDQYEYLRRREKRIQRKRAAREEENHDGAIDL